MSDPESEYIENNLKTRRQCTRDRLYTEIKEDFARRGITTETVYEKYLKRPPLSENADEIAALNAKYPLHGSHQSAAISFWKVHSNPMRQFRRTYETTKPLAEYFRETQWR